MEVLQAIYKRRATRNYEDRKVDRNTLEKLLHAAVQAPSAVNSQPWGFSVIQDKRLLDQISDITKSHLQLRGVGELSADDGHFKDLFESMSRPDFNIFYNASTLVVIYARANGYDPTGDCFLAGENFMLAACELGLATCPIGFARDVLKQSELKKKLDIPSGYEPVLPIILGYPKGETSPVERREPKVFSWKE